MVTDRSITDVRSGQATEVTEARLGMAINSIKDGISESSTYPPILPPTSCQCEVDKDLRDRQICHLLVQVQLVGFGLLFCLFPLAQVKKVTCEIMFLSKKQNSKSTFSEVLKPFSYIVHSSYIKILNQVAFWRLCQTRL
jgi:hypothetical protein